MSLKLNEILSTPIPAIFKLKQRSFSERQALAAASRNDAFIVRLFLEEIKDFNINTQDHLGRTLLDWATYYENTELVEFLLLQNAEFNMIDGKGSLPFS